MCQIFIALVLKMINFSRKINGGGKQKNVKKTKTKHRSTCSNPTMRKNSNEKKFIKKKLEQKIKKIKSTSHTYTPLHSIIHFYVHAEYKRS